MGRFSVSRIALVGAALVLLLALALARTGPVSATQQAPQYEARTMLSTSNPQPPVMQLASKGESDAVDAAIERLVEATGGTARVSRHRVTGVASFVSVNAGSLALAAGRNAPAAERAMAFLQEHGAVFGIRDVGSELSLLGSATDSYGMTHVSYQQLHRGVPVFGGTLRVHFNAAGEFTAANGVFIPKVSINTTPTLNSRMAGNIAMSAVAANPNGGETESGAPLDASSLEVAANTLYVYRDGLIQGVQGPNYLAYAVEVTDRGSVRDFVYVDAHSGRIINRYSGVHDDLHRRVYEMNYDAGSLVWEEGDPFPGALTQAQQDIVNYTEDSYYLWLHAFERDSYNGMGQPMETVNNDPRINCPNANWNGITTNYCDGTTTDDVIAHEWGHAYTEYTHNLVYQWQPGALNESYSDIFGEIADYFNGAGTDAPNPTRSAGVCVNSDFYSNPARVLYINSAPNDLQGQRFAVGPAQFGEPVGVNQVTGNVVLGEDSTDTVSDACEPLTNGAEVSGNIALVDRGTCAFTIKVKNAQDAGAVAVLVADNVAATISGMAGEDNTITIPSARITLAAGQALRDAMALGAVNVTLGLNPEATEDSVRWLIGEDATAFDGAIRDMWDPTCREDPGKVSDEEYWCATTDAGGVHSNSGVPNHGFALLVDGGSYNGQTISAIGWVKAAHIYWRAAAEYQTITSYFTDHADALEQSCQDLIGVDLEGLSTETTPVGPSGEVIDANDCAQVSAMAAAVELRSEPALCNFQPVLQPNPPALCEGTGNDPLPLFRDEFDSLDNWTLSNEGVYAGWTPRDWIIEVDLPGGRTGNAAYGIEPDIGNCSQGAGDESGVMHMDSPVLTVPASGAPLRIAFDHYIATEAGWDGGNLKISVNGGPWEVISFTNFIFNEYNALLQPAGAGNTNPMAGEEAFTGTDGGRVEGNWGQSQIDLSALNLQPGDQIQLRYDLGVDGCTGLDGWYVDWVEVYTCEGGTTAVTLSELTTTAPTRTVSLEALAIGALAATAGGLALLRRRQDS